MLNSVRLMFSQYRKNSKISNISKTTWIVYAGMLGSFDFLFLVINLMVFLLITKTISYISKICPQINLVLSWGSVLIYSLFVDTLCYYILPSWVQGQTLLQYITNGFLFNYKYVFSNIVIFTLGVMYLKISRGSKLKGLKSSRFFDNSWKLILKN